MADEEDLDIDISVIGTSQAGFSDPRGEYPRVNYYYKPSLNREIYGETKTIVSLGGGDPAVNLVGFSAGDTVPPQYGKVQVQETASGHRFIMDDTPGGERVVMYHKSGAGVELKPDGTVNIRSKNNMAIVIDANGAIVVEGDLRVSAKNLSLDVSGELNTVVHNDWNITVKGDKKEVIHGSYRQEIHKNFGQEIQKNVNKTVLGSETTTVLKNYYNIVKLNAEYTTGQNFKHGVGAGYKATSQGEMVQSAPSVSISAGDLSVVGAGGTIGGDKMIYYGNTAHIDRVNSTAMYATTFHGSLHGKAQYASAADQAATAPPGPGAGGGTYNYDSADNNQTTEPTEANMTKVLSYSTRGVVEVKVDEGDYIKNKIDRSADMGNVINRKLSPDEVRTRLKEKKHQQNAKFIAQVIADKVLSEDYINKTPPNVGRIYSGPGSVSFIPQGANVTTAGTGTGKFVTGGRESFKGFKPDSKYDPMAIPPSAGVKSINPQTEVGVGIPISTFLTGRGFATNLGHLGTFEDRQALARQLLLQSEVIKLSRYNKDAYKDFRCVVTEGVYKPYELEDITEGDVLDLSTKGRAITYELFDESNKQYPEITYQFAEYLAEYLVGYDKITLYYDQYNPNTTGIHSQITVIMPEVDEDYKCDPPKYKLETVFNGKVLSNSDLQEVINYSPPSVGKIGKAISGEDILEYNVSGIRDLPLNRSFERLLINAAKATKLDKVVITSAKQPGSSGKRLGSMRHDTGNAADVYLVYKGRILNSTKLTDRTVMTRFIQECVKLGVKGGGSGEKYMGPTIMHLDTLGQNLGSGQFNSNITTVWNSDAWFNSAMTTTA